MPFASRINRAVFLGFLTNRLSLRFVYKDLATAFNLRGFAVVKWFEETLSPDFLLRKVEWFFNKQYENKPGFLYGSFLTMPIRNVYVSEKSIIAIEQEAAKRGLQKILYAAGKEAGYRYAGSVGIPKHNFILRDAMLSSICYFFDTCWNFNVELTPNWKKKKIKTKQHATMIYRKGTFSYLLAGCWAGLWAWICDDKKLDMQLILYGNSPWGYKTDADFGPPGIIDKAVARHSRFNLPAFDEEYLSKNQAIPSDRKTLVDIPTKGGILCNFDFGGDTVFAIESSILWILQKKLGPKLSRKVIYEPTRKAYAEVFQNAKKQFKLNSKKKRRQFAADFLTTLGWGLVDETLEYKSVKGFPWCKELEEVKKPAYFDAAVNAVK